MRTVFLMGLNLVFLCLGCADQHDAARPATSPDVLDQIQQEVRVCPAGETVEGIDVSTYQGQIDWDAVAQTEVRFAIIRVSHGTRVDDNQFARNWAEAGRVGLVRGIYQFFDARDDVNEQARLLIERMGPMGPGLLPPTIDIEEHNYPNAEQLRRTALQWIEIVERELGVRPMIYTRANFWNNEIGNDSYGAYPLWIAHWDTNCPNIPRGWEEWVVQQYTDAGMVRGIDGPVDRNRFNGTFDDLIAFTGGGDAVCGDGVCSPNELGRDCPQDCPHCMALNAEGGIVSEESDCFFAGGPTRYWRDEAIGHDGHLHWTHTTDSDTAANYAEWTLNFTEPGSYRVEAHTTGPWPKSQQADYRVQHAEGESSVIRDQNAVDGWLSLGEFNFEAGVEHRIRLDDNTGEPNNTMTKLVADAVRLTRLDLPPPMEDAGISPPPDMGVEMGDGGTTEGDDGGSVDSGMADEMNDVELADGWVNSAQEFEDAGPLGSPTIGAARSSDNAGGCAVETGRSGRVTFLFLTLALLCTYRRRAC